MSDAPNPNRKKPSRAASHVAGDWFGCGRTITKAGWDGFLAAQAEYWRQKDAAANAQSPATTSPEIAIVGSRNNGENKIHHG